MKANDRLGLPNLSRRTLLRLGAALPLLSWPGEVLADAGTDALLAEIAAARKPIKSLIAKFKQTRVIGLLATPVDSKGQLTMVLPDRLRWDLFPPDEVTYWVSPAGIAYRAGKDKKATKAPADAFGAALTDLLAFLGGDLASLKSRYSFSARKEKDGSIDVVAVVTHAELKKTLKQLRLITNPEKWGVAKVVMDEPKGDSSTIVFEPNQKDAKIPAADMAPPA